MVAVELKMTLKWKTMTISWNKDVVWKDVPRYEGKYQVSNTGLIKSLPRLVRGRARSGTVFQRRVPGRILKPGKYCKSGHVSVVLGHGENGSPVHQLVALAFMGATPEGMEILHNNGNPKDNRLSNLRFGTRTENILDVYRQGKKWRKAGIDEVKEIRKRIGKGEKGVDISKDMGLSQQIISSIKTGRSFGWLE